ncbi:MAG: carbohydrate binding domain-containing protein [Deltaproteobacteria bacterium]|nr:carbohydrate binding domain-containing protein [Deltaproteobacteria bacterium]
MKSGMHVRTLFVGVCVWAAAFFGSQVSRAAPPQCQAATVRFSPDFSVLVGNGDYADFDGDLESGSMYRWLVNGQPVEQGPVGELLFLSFDDTLDGAGGQSPTASSGVAYDQGLWGSALALQTGGAISYQREGNLNLSEGTITMWVALRADGDDSTYSDRSHVLFQYWADNGDTLSIAQSDNSGVVYAGGKTDGQWQSAYSGRATMTGWKAGRWHWLAYSFSESGNFMRFYLDGVLVADTNEDQYVAPAATGGAFRIGADRWDNEAYYLIDSVRILDHPAGDEALAAAMVEPEPFQRELATSQLQVGDQVVFEVTPSDGSEMGSACASDPVTYPGIPILDPDPPSTILPTGAEHVNLTVHTISGMDVRYSVGDVAAYAAMTPFDSGDGTTDHSTVVSGIDPDPNVVTHVYVRCSAYPDFVMDLKYRSLSDARPSYPKTGNLWGSSQYCKDDLSKCARVDLWLGAHFNADQIRQLRAMNPNILVLTSINTIENDGLPDDYYLKDVDGKKVEVWPGSYRLNMTKDYVAEYQAHYAYQKILDNGLMDDGCFFDNFMTSQSWLKHDIYGNPFHPDANEDGQEDDLDALDVAWKAGVFHEMETFRRLMPGALVCGHSMDIYQSGIAERFNGISIGFWTTDVIEGKRSFDDLWARYVAWNELAVAPHVTMIESSPPDQISYGYDYSPWEKIPPSTLEFARTYYPYVRFGLAFTLMYDGYFAHEFGDTWHGNRWWYDELDYDLGQPLGAAQTVSATPDGGENLLANGDFEQDISSSDWTFHVNEAEGCAGSVTRDTSDATAGQSSIRMQVDQTCGEVWRVELTQQGPHLDADQPYVLRFSAKASAERPMRLNIQRNKSPWDNFGLSQTVALKTDWTEYIVPFAATETTDEAITEFMLGDATGTVWLDDVRLFVRHPYIMRRDFENGLVLLNPLHHAQTVPIESGFHRITGSQAPFVEYIVDDADDGVTFQGTWTGQEYDSGEWKATRPFYHNWGPGCHESSGDQAEASFPLSIPQADEYHVLAWWAAAPAASSWSKDVEFAVLVNDEVVSATNLDQSTGGDEWHEVAVLPLDPDQDVRVRVRAMDGADCVADALHVWSKARYNDGSDVSTVTLGPMDGILLARAGHEANHDGGVDGDGSASGDGGGASGGSKSGCGCHSGGGGDQVPLWLLVIGCLGLLVRRRGTPKSTPRLIQNNANRKE